MIQLMQDEKEKLLIEIKEAVKLRKATSILEPENSEKEIEKIYHLH